jgi:chitin disaccharide deacetylase
VLIVTADDFGLTAGVSHGILRAHREGIVTAASIIGVGAAFEIAGQLARETPSLSLGVHLALVGEDPPLLTAQEIPTLVDDRGRFPRSWRTLVARAAARRIDPADVRREFSAQLERARGIGVPLSHLDTHQHVHLWPEIAEVAIQLARDHGIRALRVPCSHGRTPVGFGVAILGRQLRARAERAGLLVTDTHVGLEESGRIDKLTLARAIRRAARCGATTAELTVHPGEHNDPELARFAWGFGWGRELEALVDPTARELVSQVGYRLGSFDDLATHAEATT